jgi:hypothetical protein
MFRVTLKHVQDAVTALNGEFDLRAEAIRRGGFGSAPPGFPSDQDFAHESTSLRALLRRWVDEWWLTYGAAWTRNPEEAATAFLAARPELVRELCRLSRAPQALREFLELNPDRQLLAREALAPESLRRSEREWTRDYYARVTRARGQQVDTFFSFVRSTLEHGDSIVGPSVWLGWAEPDLLPDDVALSWINPQALGWGESPPVLDEQAPAWAKQLASLWAAPKKILHRNVEVEGVRLFVLLLLSPWRIGKCHCGLFFVNVKGRRQSCKHAHAQGRVYQQQRVELLAKLKAKRDKVRDARLERVRAAIAEYEKASALPDDDRQKRASWKPWVAKRAAVTPNFLTWYVNKGLLEPPKIKEK